MCALAQACVRATVCARVRARVCAWRARLRLPQRRLLRCPRPTTNPLRRGARAAAATAAAKAAAVLSACALTCLATPCLERAH
jgi:hypothetical protein